MLSHFMMVPASLCFIVSFLLLNGILPVRVSANAVSLTHNISLSSSKNASGDIFQVKAKVWIASIVSITVISAVGLVGVAVVPLVQKVFYNHVTQFLVALAVGSLTGDAMLHLLPHAIVSSLLENSQNNHGIDEKATIWKGLAALGGVYLFFFCERVVVLITEYRAEQKAKEEDAIGKLRKQSVATNPSETARSLLANVENSMITGSGGPTGQSQTPRGTSPTQEAPLRNHSYSKLLRNSDIEDFVTTGISSRAMKNIDNIKRLAHSDVSLPPHLEEACLPMMDDLDEEHGLSQMSSHCGSLRRLSYGDSTVSPNTPRKCFNMNENVALNEFAYNDSSAVQILGKHPRANYNGETNVQRISQEYTSTGYSGDGHVPSATHSYKKVSSGHSHTHTTGPSHGHGHSHQIPGSMQAVMWMVILGDGLHNFSDGLAIGAAFAQNISGGVSTAVAVFCHELPHELGDFAALLSAGMPVKRAILYNILSSILCVIGMLIGIALGNVAKVSYWIFAIAGGTFMYIALVDMLPELGRVERRPGESRLVHFMLHNLGILTGVSIMLVIALYEDKIKQLLDWDSIKS